MFGKEGELLVIYKVVRVMTVMIPWHNMWRLGGELLAWGRRLFGAMLGPWLSWVPCTVPCVSAGMLLTVCSLKRGVIRRFPLCSSWEKEKIELSQKLQVGLDIRWGYQRHNIMRNDHIYKRGESLLLCFISQISKESVEMDWEDINSTSISIILPKLTLRLVHEM